MKMNMGALDRGFRIALAIVIATLYFSNQISGALAVVLGVVAILFLLTSFVRFCPLYSPFRIATTRKHQ